MYSTWPYVYGYSLIKRKGWGEFLVDILEEIEFNEDVFDHLVVPKNALLDNQDIDLSFNRKELIKALVLNKEKQQVQDIVSGKGGGLIFLLHGPPGVGKTLTAEATAEILHKPLYTVSVGELGCTPVDVEESLSKILEIAEIWDAVILLDEADIFLEARTTENITRNAIVGIFLRLLEYHNGIIFLTTNRINNFDCAIMNRISMTFFYEDLELETRKKVWKNLFEAFKIDDSNIDIYKLAEYRINGRQIKNTIRLSQCLAASRGELVNQNHLHFILNQDRNDYSFGSNEHDYSKKPNNK